MGCENRAASGVEESTGRRHSGWEDRRRRTRRRGAAAARERRAVRTEPRAEVRSASREATAPLNAPARTTMHGAAAGSAASRRASGARSDRRERRREGYPPEGSRPRSGLDRVARSRSDAPVIPAWSAALDSNIGIGITVRTIALAVGKAAFAVAEIVAGACARSLGKEKAAEPPRSAAPQATRAARANAGRRGCPTKKEAGRAAWERRGPRGPVRATPRGSAAPECRA